MSDEKIVKVRLVDTETGEDVTDKYVSAPPSAPDDWAVVEEALTTTSSTYASSPFAALARLREREAQRDEAVSRLEARVLGLIGDRNRAEARVAELERVLTWLAKDEAWATAWPDGAFGLPPNTWGPAPSWVQTVARRALAHEEEA